MCFAINKTDGIDDAKKDYIINKATESNEHCKETLKKFGILTIGGELIKIFIKGQGLGDKDFAAKKHQGQFILRIEDTDLERNQEEFVNNLYQDLLWLGIKPDESIFQPGDYSPYRQTQRLSIYRKYIEQLLKAKKVYLCFCSSEELVQEKEKYIKTNQKRNYQYSRKCLKLSENEIQTFLHQQKPHVLRLKIPQERNYFFPDLVRGEVKFQGQDIEDFVLFRQNGIPNYNFACVVDDHFMKISHVLRGEEHLSNTGKQLKKLSKRDQETSQWQLISQLRAKGTTQEIFSLSEAVKEFNLKGLNASGAVYDLEKLN
ncbi:9078_t:CDS:2 [Ambispora gerdemannii]|uniref:9078_t:CDS:1 n=1 Tax=Ambispora gerdemannii TaxID=144530 RepID=A0A9N8YUB4_9GLOM|nr:9078_t:CDS:2 [Ambispora gerdemannii]